MRRGRSLSFVLFACAGLAAQAAASCADSPPSAQATLDASTDPDVVVLPPQPDADASHACTADEWCAVALPPSPMSLNGIWGSGPADVWIVGSPDVTLHWDGSALTTGKVGTRQTLFGVWGSGPKDVWAFSAGNAMWHSDGYSSGDAGWSFFDGDAGGWPGSIAAMGGSGADDVWAVGAFMGQVGAPPVWHCDGWNSGVPKWQFVATSAAVPPEPEPFSFDAIWGNPESGLWIVGMGGKTRVGRKSKGTIVWKAVNSGTSMDLNAVWGVAGGDVWAAGAGGTMRRFVRGLDGEYQAAGVEFPTDATIFGMTGFAADDVWAVGSGGTVVHWNGQAWSLVSMDGDAHADGGGPDDLFSIWGSSPDDLWAVGRNTLLHKGSAALPRKSP
ncbi:hypothetical protein [Labilithrix luteola]|nr:hypothetical protein [Labilithrix luteola]